MIEALIILYVVLMMLAYAAPDQTSTLVLTLAYLNDILSPARGGIFCDLIGGCP
jgi:hypothetical protein